MADVKDVESNEKDILNNKLNTDGVPTPEPVSDSEKEDVSAEKPKPRYLTTNSESEAGLFGSLFLTWMYPFLSLGHKRQLNLSDLGPMNPVDEPTVVSAELKALWQEEQSRAKPSLIRAVRRMIGAPILLACLFFAAVQAGLGMFAPFLTQWILESLTGFAVLSTGRLAGYTFLSSIIPLVNALCQAHLLRYARRASLHMYISLTCVIFEKSMKVRQVSSGRVSVLIASDAATNIDRCIQMIFPIFIALPQLAILLWLLHRQLGTAVFAGIGTVVAFVPLNLWIFARIQSAFSRIMKRTDVRLQKTNELLGAIRVVKAYAWEKILALRIDAAREQELDEIRTHSYWYNIGLSAVFLQMPNILQIVTLWTYYGLDGSFAAYTIFPALQFFAQISQPLSQFPNAVSTTTQAIVALQRIQAFLEEAELPESPFETTTKGGDDVLELKDIEAGGKKVELVTVAPGTSLRWPSEPPGSNQVSEGEDKKKKKAKKGAEAETEVAKPLPPLALTDLNLNLFSGELIAVVGRVGCGKSSLLCALLGELLLETGSIQVRGRTSYTAQDPFVMGGSLRENILFGNDFDDERYFSLIEACALVSDLKGFRGGDAVPVGESGITLSGGQRARMSLCRALYADSSVVLLDDPLAAVDSHVGEKLFDTLLTHPLVTSRLRLLVTNQIARLPRCHRIIVLNNGKLEGFGTYEELVQQGVDFERYAEEDDVKSEEVPTETLATEVVQSPKERRASVSSVPLTFPVEEGMGGSAAASVQLAAALVSEMEGARLPAILSGEAEPDTASMEDDSDALISNNKKQDAPQSPVDEKVKARRKAMAEARATSTADIRAQAEDLFGEEKRLKGAIVKAILADFIRTSGKSFFWGGTILNILYLVMPQVGTILVGQLTTLCSNPLAPCTKSTQTTWLGAYTAMILGSLILCLIAGLLLAVVRVQSARGYHRKLVHAVTVASIQFFDATPLGRISNRFTKDQGVIDTTLQQMLMWTQLTGGMVLGAIVATAYSTKGVFLAFLLPIGFAFVRFFLFQRGAGVDLVRLEGATRAPIYSNFQEAVVGRVTVRAFKKINKFRLTNDELLRVNIVPFFLGRTGLISFMTAWLNVVGTVATMSVSYFVVFSGIIDSGNAGVALTSVSMITGVFYFFIIIATDFEQQLQSIYRVNAFCGEALEHEERAYLMDADPPAETWPKQGAVRVESLVAGYREGPDVLKGFDLNIRPGESVGVVGRTGSGKSTFLLCLLRIIEARKGGIFIDEVEISSIGLETLRSRIGLIPQNPTLFMGTLRYNVDPLGVKTDLDIWAALDAVQLGQMIRPLEGGLEYMVSEGGENLSMGQRQLLCCARALLRDSKLLLLDEASASLDAESDRALQSTLRTVFKGRTTIAIAHRLETIADCSRVLVLDKGVVAQYEAPLTLLRDEAGIFKGMVDALDDSAAKRVKEMATSSYDVWRTTFGEKDQ